MGYLHIDNLYKNQEILMFKECYAMEKIHGTSAHITFLRIHKGELEDEIPWEYFYHIKFSSGGEKHDKFANLFNKEELIERFKEIGVDDMIVYGEAYGGKQQGMSDTYGKKLKFIVFDIKMGHSWLNVLDAEKITKQLGLEFVHYVKIPTGLGFIDGERDTDSVQAYRNGIGKGKKREGVVLRPLIEVKKNNGARIICKHKRDDFRETKTKREINPETLKILSEAKAIAEEWVTEMRLTHVLDKFPEADITQTGNVVKAMIEDIKREGDKEINWSKEVSNMIGKKSAIIFKNRIKGGE